MLYPGSTVGATTSEFASAVVQGLETLTQAMTRLTASVQAAESTSRESVNAQSDVRGDEDEARFFKYIHLLEADSVDNLTCREFYYRTYYQESFK